MARSESDATLSGRFEEYRGPILRHVTALIRDPVEAEDITQETFTRAYAKLPTLQDDARLLAWLYRIATNLSYDRFRRVSRRPAHLSLEGALDPEGGKQSFEPAAETSPKLDLVMEQEEMSSCVRRYLEELPDPYRAVILLHDVQGLTNPEIAEMLGCSLESAKIRLHRARKKLRGALARACELSQDSRGVTVCEPKGSRSPPAGD